MTNENPRETGVRSAAGPNSTLPDSALLRGQTRRAIRQVRLEAEWAGTTPHCCSICGESDLRLDHRDLCSRCATVVDVDTVTQLRRRRAASDRLPPLEHSGDRDPWGAA
jgi:hypothetical protein